MHARTHTHTHTHTHLTALCPGLPGWAGTRKVKPNLDFIEAILMMSKQMYFLIRFEQVETVDGQR